MAFLCKCIWLFRERLSSVTPNSTVFMIMYSDISLPFYIPMSLFMSHTCSIIIQHIPFALCFLLCHFIMALNLQCPSLRDEQFVQEKFEIVWFCKSARLSVKWYSNLTPHCAKHEMNLDYLGAEFLYFSYICFSARRRRKK